MEDPANEIVPLIKRLTTSPSPSVLRADIEAFFLPNAGFRHPLCYAAPGPRSRDAILNIYAHYRSLSPHTISDSRVLAYDKEKNILVVETVQQFHLFFSPFRTAPSRLVTNVILSRDDADGRHYIAYQEDFYHPDHFMNLLVPPLARVIRFALWSGTVVSGLLAPVGTLLGLFAEPPSLAQRVPHASMHLYFNPTQIVGSVLKGIDGVVRSRGVRSSKEDVVETVPGDESLMYQVGL